MKNNNSESKVTFPAFIGATIPKNTVVSKKIFFDLSIEYDKIRSSLGDAIVEMKQAVIDRYAEFKVGDKVVITFPDESEQKSAVCFISHVIARIPARETERNQRCLIGEACTDASPSAFTIPRKTLTC